MPGELHSKDMTVSISLIPPFNLVIVTLHQGSIVTKSHNERTKLDDVRSFQNGTRNGISHVFEMKINNKSCKLAVLAKY